MHKLRRAAIAASLAVAAGSATGCSGAASAPLTQDSPTTPAVGLVSDGWSTYRQPPGPMHLSFKYPQNWTATGRTLDVSAGGRGAALGIAYLHHDLSRSLGSRPISSGKCRARAEAVGGHGVLVLWTATIGVGRFSQLPGRHLTVHGRPARLHDATVATECAGSQLSHVPEHVVTGAINEGDHTIQTMTAVTGLNVGAGTLATIHRIFRSTRP
ncbi:MAG TPA: hypothetical protein VMH41_11470 [Mycobacteriales bacterium]|nr:hypothetical protein [Mycobacteriales bacterium]